MVSPTPSSRDISARLLSARESQRGRSQYLGHNNHMNLGKPPRPWHNFPRWLNNADGVQGSLTQPETPFGLNDASLYDNSARLSFSTSNHFNTLSQDGFRLNHGSHLQPKHEDYSTSTTGDPLSNSSNNQFLAISESNPLFSQDRLFLSPYSQSSTNQHLSSLAFTPINRSRDRAHATHHDQEQRPLGASIKLEAQFCEGIENVQSHDSKQSSFTANGIWDPQGPETGVELHAGLDEEQLDM